LRNQAQSLFWKNLLGINRYLSEWRFHRQQKHQRKSKFPSGSVNGILVPQKYREKLHLTWETLRSKGESMRQWQLKTWNKTPNRHWTLILFKSMAIDTTFSGQQIRSPSLINMSTEED
jgi:hypothetical protein